MLKMDSLKLLCLGHNLINNRYITSKPTYTLDASLSEILSTFFVWF